MKKWKLVFALVFFAGCGEEPPPDCDALNTGITIHVKNEYPGRLNFWYRVVNVRRKKTDASSGLWSVFRSNSEKYECKERTVDILAFHVDPDFEGSKEIQSARELISLENVNNQLAEPLVIDPSAKTSTSIIITEEGKIIGVDLIN